MHQHRLERRDLFQFMQNQVKHTADTYGDRMPQAFGRWFAQMYFQGISNIAIPENAHEDLRTRIEQIRNEEIHVSGSPTTARFAWWKASKETTKVERQFHVKPDYYVHLVLCEEGGRWILYVEWAV